MFCCKKSELKKQSGTIEEVKSEKSNFDLRRLPNGVYEFTTKK